MTVLDTTVVVDFLLGVGVGPRVGELLHGDQAASAPDVLVFEVLAVLRRSALRGTVTEERATGAVAVLGDLPLELFPSLALRQEAWALRHRLTSADALFAALAAYLSEPLATTDRGLANAAEREGLAVLRLGA